MFKNIWGRQLVIALAIALVVVAVAAGASFAAPNDNPNEWGGCNGVFVGPGMTLSGIAAQYGVSVWSLAQYNGISNPNYIRIGQCICIPPHGSSYYNGGWGYNYSPNYNNNWWCYPGYNYGYNYPNYGYKGPNYNWNNGHYPQHH
ncbi:MAG: LysM peptidoglycan-binding domain-containing protein [Anaerolineae bacterium]